MCWQRPHLHSPSSLLGWAGVCSSYTLTLPSSPWRERPTLALSGCLPKANWQAQTNRGLAILGHSALVVRRVCILESQGLSRPARQALAGYGLGELHRQQAETLLSLSAKKALSLSCSFSLRPRLQICHTSRHYRDALTKLRLEGRQGRVPPLYSP